jgi:FAD-linked oxidoreductase
VVAVEPGRCGSRRRGLRRAIASRPDPPTQDAAGHLVGATGPVQYAYPAERAAPKSEEELLDVLARSPAPIRPVGAGHSFTRLVPTNGTLLTLDGMAGLVSHDAPELRATFRAGTRLGDIGPALAAVGQEMPNLPDINKQSLAGALATGTHGTGRRFKALHGGVVGFSIATPNHGILDCSPTRNSALFYAARVGLGAFGVLTQVTLQNAKLTRVKKRVEPRPLDEVIEAWPALQQAHRNVEFFVLPFTGIAAVITADETTEPVRPRGPDTDADTLMRLKRLRDWTARLPALRRWIAEKVLAAGFEPEARRGLEAARTSAPCASTRWYHLPSRPDARAPRVVATIERHRPDASSRSRRVIDADDAWLSPFYERLTDRTRTTGGLPVLLRADRADLPPLRRSSALGQDAQSEGR